MKSVRVNVGKRSQISAYQIIGLDLVVFSAWKRDVGVMGKYRTITHVDDGTYSGKIGSCEILDPRIDSIPVGPDRFLAVDLHYARQYRRAYAIIRSQFPTLEGTERDGEILCSVATAEAAIEAVR